MQNIFMTVLEMSIAAGYCAVFVMLARLCMRKLPKGYSYVLWALVFARLLLPVMPESSWSFLPKAQILGVNQRIEAWIDKEEAAVGQAGTDKDGISQAGANAGGVGQLGNTELNTGQNVGIGFDVGNAALGEIGLGAGTGLSRSENESAAFSENAEKEEVWLTLLSRVWLAGSVLLVGYALVANVLLEKRLKGATEMEDGVYEIENLPTAFVTGLLNPRIYFPAGLSEEYRCYVLEHERTHLKRGDVWVKYIAYILVSIHWFNPLVWISYVLMCRDMEMSCDERVLENLGLEEKKAYSTALLAVASGHKIQLGIPVAFGEHGAKNRIVNVLHYRKPAFWVTAAAGMVLAVLAVGLLSDPQNTEEVITPQFNTEEVITPQFDSMFLAQVEEWVDVMRPHDQEYVRSSRWFEDFAGRQSPQLIEYNDSDIIFYPRVSDDIQKVIKKMLGVTTDVPYMELEKYEDRIWLVEYQEETYLLVQREGVCRLQKYEDMIQYKQKEVELEYAPIYPEDLKSLDALSEKMACGVNAVFLFLDYKSAKELDTVTNKDVVFDFARGFWETEIIDYYFDEETYYQAMARKTGQELSEFLAKYKVNQNPHGRIYNGAPLDSVYSDIAITDVKWLEDSNVAIYYSGGYWEGMAVMKEHDGEMIFVSNRKISKNEVTTENENWRIFMEQNPGLMGIEDWLEDAASPIAYGGVADWFEEYNEEELQLVYEDATAKNVEVVFYQGVEENLQQIITKLLEIIHASGSLKGEFSYIRYLEEKTNHVGKVWLIKYLADYYVMMEWQGVYRLQRLEDIMKYKENEIQFEYVPLYAGDFSDIAILSEKLSKKVNLLLLYRDYEEVSDFDPKENYEDVFFLVTKVWNGEVIDEDIIIKRYLNETKYYEAMARKTGQSMNDMLVYHDIELTSYNKLYAGVQGSVIYAQARVNEVKWLNDTQVEVRYAFGWFEDGYDTHYFDGVSVWEEHNGEMIFVSNRRIYD